MRLSTLSAAAAAAFSCVSASPSSARPDAAALAARGGLYQYYHAEITPRDSSKTKPKVFIVSMFDPEAEVWWGIPEFDLLAKNVSVPGFSPLFPEAHCTADGEICQLVTGEGGKWSTSLSPPPSLCFVTSSSHFRPRPALSLLAVCLPAASHDDGWKKSRRSGGGRDKTAAATRQGSVRACSRMGRWA